MEKYYDGENVFLKLLYYCNLRKEIYFKRSDVTEYLISSGIFDIPNKQGFDGNLSYFGFDIKNDIDKDRILLLRGNRLNERCLMGSLDIRKIGNRFLVVDDDLEILNEIDRLINNKTDEARAFNDRKRIVSRYGLNECSFRLFGNKKIYSKNNEYFVFPDVVFDCINHVVLYEVVNHENLEVYKPSFIFPLYDTRLIYLDDKIMPCEELGELEKNFYYYTYRADDEMLSEVEIQEMSNEKIIQLINKLEYDLTGKESTKKVLNSIRLNTGALRALAINRDHYRCVLCAIANSKLLICSHIKPWKTGDGRLDINNVLTLCTLHDALFDKGFISFDQDGNMLYSNDEVLRNDSIKSFLEKGNNKLTMDINHKMKQYIRYHYEQIFIKTPTGECNNDR
jgi:hypothetical protein